MASVTRHPASAVFLADFATVPPPARVAGGWQSIAGYAAALAACLGVLATVFIPWGEDFRTPYAYHGDALYTVAAIKGMVENGWYLENPSLAAPFGQEIYDYPMADGLHFACLKILSYSASSPGAVFNLYYLASFPLTTFLSLAVLRRFGVSFPSAIFAALLYTFLPWHFLRMEHLFLACYYLVPPMIMVVLEVYLGLLDREKEAGGRRVRLRAASICLLVGTAGIYYAFFGCFLLVVAGAARLLERRHWRSLVTPIALTALITLSVLVSLSPNLAYRWLNGSNREIVRYVSEAEYYGLRFTQLLLPHVNHRLAAFARVTHGYNLALGNGYNENSMVSLGVIGGCGFVGLLGVALFGRGRLASSWRLLHASSVLTLAAFLLGTVAGVGALFNQLVFKDIRSYNRIAIYIAFFSLFAVALVAERLRQRWPFKAPGTYAFALLLALLTLLGILDETNSHARTEIAHGRARFQEDEQYIAELEERVPSGSMIYQMPYVPFPESPGRKEFMDYDLLRPYIHSHGLRWSYGAMRARAADGWHRHLAQQPIEEQLAILAHAGFAGITIDRAGYREGSESIERELKSRLGPPTIVSTSERFAFYDLNHKR